MRIWSAGTAACLRVLTRGAAEPGRAVGAAGLRRELSDLPVGRLKDRAEQLGVSRALLSTHFRGCGLDAPAQPAQVEWVLTQAPPRPVVVPRRCHAGASFGVVVGRDTPRAETVVPGANPCIEPLPPGTRVFEVLAPTAPLLAVEKEAQEGAAADGAEGARVRGVRRWEVVGQLQRGEALVLPPTVRTPSHLQGG